MSHRVALYQVRVRPKRDVNGWRLFGDYDESGTWFGVPVGAMLPKLYGQSADGRVEARFDAPLPGIKGDQVGAALRSGRSGVTSVIERDGDPPFDRTSDHVEAMRSAVLFELPKNQRAGRLAVHVPHGRSCKGIVEKGLKATMRELGFVVELSPIVPANALREAVERDALERVTLIKHDPSHSDKFAAAAQWGTDAVEKVELSIPSGRNRRLRRDPLKRFIDDPSDANRRQIIEFQGLIFDEASITVELPDGVRRTFFLDGREGGHAMTMGIDVDAVDRLGATPEVLARELADALKAVPVAP
jgi:hypothetical protein